MGGFGGPRRRRRAQPTPPPREAHASSKRILPAAFVCDELPAKAGIDPLLELIDRHPEDNVVAVSVP